MGPDVLFAATAAVYAAAAMLFVAHLAGSRSDLAIAWAPRLVGLGAALHAGHIIVSSLVLNVCPIKGVHFAMSVISMLACVGYSLLRLRLRDREGPSFDVVGVFVAPVALTFLLASRLVNAHEPEGAVKSAILPIHVLVILLGYAAFMLAFAAAVTYLVQEKQLKKKRLTGVFLRLPPLDALERVEYAFLLVGFPLLTVGILTGTLWATRVEHGSSVEVWRAIFGYAAWLLFAAVLVLRRALGWRGKKAAYGTIAGFGFAVLVLALYLVRALGVSA